jgi:hypothetical protein
MKEWPLPVMTRFTVCPSTAFLWRNTSKLHNFQLHFDSQYINILFCLKQHSFASPASPGLLQLGQSFLERI